MFCPNEIIIHCTASHQSCTLNDLRSYHLSRGFSDIGYHFVIFPDGCLMVGRPLTKIGAHCRGHNKNSIGIAWVGGLNGARNMTPQQLLSLRAIIIFLGSKVFSFDTLSTHHFYNPHKSCPNYSLNELFSDSVLSLFKHLNG